jgi:hypothetical protein
VNTIDSAPKHAAVSKKINRFSAENIVDKVMDDIGPYVLSLIVVVLFFALRRYIYGHPSGHKGIGLSSFDDGIGGGDNGLDLGD